MFRECTELTIFPVIYYEFIIFIPDLLDVSRIHYQFCEFIMNSFWFPRFRCRFHENTINILSASRIHYGLTIYFAKVPRIHYLFRNFNINSLSISQIHRLVSEYIKNSLSFSRIHYQNANSQFSREFTLDSQAI